jgi:L-lactate dehydrogenase (cytochrome)
MQFAIAASGEAGLKQLWNVLLDETSLTLAQLGKTSMRSLPETRAPECL